MFNLPKGANKLGWTLENMKQLGIQPAMAFTHNGIMYKWVIHSNEIKILCGAWFSTGYYANSHKKAQQLIRSYV